MGPGKGRELREGREGCARGLFGIGREFFFFLIHLPPHAATRPRT